MLAALIACRRIMVLPDPCASRQFGMNDWEHVYACLGEGLRRVNLGHVVGDRSVAYIHPRDVSDLGISGP
jgi:hypothetical protein